MNAPDLDLIAEHDQGHLLPQAALDWFVANGVNGLSLAKTAGGQHDFVRIDDIVWLPHGAFEFARHLNRRKSDTSCTILVRDQLGDPIDIVAWQAKTGRIARWLCRAAMLGEDELLAPRDAEGLRVFETPLQWLQHRRAGVVVLDKRLAAPMLRDAAPLLAVNFEHGKKLQDMLRVPTPRILVPSSASTQEAA